MNVITAQYGHQFTAKVRRYSAGASELRLALAKCDFDVMDDFEREMFCAFHEHICKLERAAIDVDDEVKDKV